MSDPFLITGPAVVSFSGGRTSAYMLHRILEAHGGTLPPDVLVCFANTGREMPATLDFVRDCGAAWNVTIRWLEYRRGFMGGAIVRAVEVNHNSASRNGEPLEALFRAKSMLPNPVMRFCTQEGKINTVRRFVQTEYGWTSWTNVVGLRADEMGRVARLNRRPAPYVSVAPLAEAGVEQIDVFRFWQAQPFDLGLAGAWEGNCDGCFLKGRASLERMFLEHPERMAWWSDVEQERGNTFRADREDYATMARTVRDQGRLPFDLHEATIPCDEAGCGI
jgi:3'-phosphoadenosine 5'-phosphosulfate sulfotransferase (PAPS reductase)/FAD synthetase